jgi:hypothetical protein
MCMAQKIMTKKASSAYAAGASSYQKDSSSALLHLHKQP